MTPTERQAALEQVAREYIQCLPFTGTLGEYDNAVRKLVSLLAAQRAAGLEEAQGIVESEEELPGDMPEEMFQAITGGDRAIAAETLRAVVRATKKSITSRLKEQRP